MSLCKVLPMSVSFPTHRVGSQKGSCRYLCIATFKLVKYATDPPPQTMVDIKRSDAKSKDLSVGSVFLYQIPGILQKRCSSDAMSTKELSLKGDAAGVKRGTIGYTQKEPRYHWLAGR